MSRRRFNFRIAWGSAAIAGLLIGLAHAQTRQLDSFDAKVPQWQRGPANVPFAEEAHVITDQFVHSFPSAEYLRVKAEPSGQLNPSIRYEYPTSPAPVTDDLSAGVWVRANRPGVQLFARLVLPKERNPENLSEPLTTLLRGESYNQGGGHWQRLELRFERRGPVRMLKDEQQMLRARLQRDINVADAYIDRLILNLHTGPGVTEVWIDDLDIGPVLEPAKERAAPGQMTALSKSNAASPPAGTPGAVTPVRPVPAPDRRSTAVPVEFNRGLFRVDRKPFFFRAIRYSDTPVHALRNAGFNTLFVEKSDPALCDEAAREGLWLVPVLPAMSDPAVVSQAVARFPADDAVLFWHLGDDRTAAQIDPLTRTIQAVRAADPQRPIAADVWDGVWGYSVNVDLMSAHRFPLMTSLDLVSYRNWLVQRKALSRSPFFWTWVQTHLPDWYLNTVLPESARSEFNEPIGPQAEQIRLLTYIALAAGCKGLAFWSDRFLADSHQGRDRLLMLALLNQEIQMLEPLLFGVAAAPSLNDWIEADNIKEVKAAVLRCDRGVLVLPMWLGQGAQFVPGQSASNRVTLTVPQVPNGTQAWEVSPAEVKSLPAQRVAGGTRVTLNEFDQTSILVFTSDNSPTGLLVRWQEQSRRMVKQAAALSYQLAAVEITKVEKVEAELAQLAPIPEAANLLAKARQLVKVAEEKWNAEDYRGSYREAQRALRPLRILMRAHWEQASKSLGEATATASPYAVSYYTLPKHWQFRQELEQTSPGGNLLPDGDFERTAEIPAGWQVARIAPDDVVATVRLSGEEPHEGKHCLAIQIKPKPAVGPNPAPPPEALEPTFVAAVSPPVKLTPGSLVRVTGWIKVLKPITASPDGAILFDSAGGEPLGVRIAAPTKDWRKITLYRRVPASGLMQVTAALTGLGTVYFDDLKIEPLNGAGK